MHSNVLNSKSKCGVEVVIQAVAEQAPCHTGQVSAVGGFHGRSLHSHTHLDTARAQSIPDQQASKTCPSRDGSPFRGNRSQTHSSGLWEAGFKPSNKTDAAELRNNPKVMPYGGRLTLIKLNLQGAMSSVFILMCVCVRERETERKERVCICCYSQSLSRV